MKSIARLETFDVEVFVSDYWQQRPCLIGNWLRPDPLSLDELLDLADEHDLPSRLVTGNQKAEEWTLTHGPLDELPMASRDWTVLVQEVDKACPEVADILKHFDFLPDWMIDDVMISQAVDGGSVGAHVDAYDVFLVQAAGCRRWQLAEHFDAQTDERFELALLKYWQPEVELMVKPGEVLYLPPGVAHHGVADGDCQTWSVGMRTPSGPELLFYLAERLAESSGHARRLGVPHPDPGQPSRIHVETLGDIRRLLEQCLQLNDHQLADLAGRFLTSWRTWPMDQAPATMDQINATLANGQSLALSPAARLALTEDGDETTLYVNGEPIKCPSGMACELARTRTLNPVWLDHPDVIEQLLEADTIAPIA